MQDDQLIPIDTDYKGYYFRSRLEARYAVMFDALGWDWRYEHEGFQLESGWYLPDFYFPDLNIYAEVKPHEIVGKDLQRCLELSRKMNRPDEITVLLLEGELDYKHHRTLQNGHVSLDAIPMPKCSDFYPFFWSDSFEKRFFDETYMAIKKAKSARFEFEWKEF